ncbi:MFS transporter [Herbihabitans rhizosphaerae]|uniref:MFS transporter n=1 Tax=Herbihabitans rhizosphaerae TaxID=1872711 RepID=UPI00102C41A4|nr:MFS transporter [Herbihabitans rhizosphaerae]
MGARRLLAIAGFRRLLLSRFAGQWGEGLFQAGLAGAVIFNPERAADPLTIAGGFTALLLPYSIVGPFAGALLDRWDRRRVIVVANLLRGTMILLSAVAVATGVGGAGLFTLALVVIGVSRFVGSGLSASLPHVVPVRNLVEANALATTLGAVVSVIGAGCAVGLRAIFGEGNVGSGLTTSVAVIGMVIGAIMATRFTRGALGPDEVDEPSATMVAVARGLLDGGRAALRTPTVLAGFAAMLAYRISFGISLLLTVLLMRYSFTDMGPLKAGLPGIGQMVAAAGLGILAAGLLTARFTNRFGRRHTVVGALLLGAVAQLACGLPMVLPTMLLASFLVMASGQVIKLCVDAAVQRDVGDEVRGRVFALYDTLFNITQVVAIAIAAAVVPLDGRAPGLVVAAALAYVAGLAGFLAVHRRHPDL